MNNPIGIKVYIRNLAGESLTGSSDDWSFTPERAIAHIFDFHADEVAQQLEQAQRDLGVRWVACSVDLSLSGQRLRASDATFDVTRFLCPACGPK